MAEFEMARLSESELREFGLPSRTPSWMTKPAPEAAWTLDRARGLCLCAAGGGWLLRWRGHWWWWEAQVRVDAQAPDAPSRWRMTALRSLAGEQPGGAATLWPPLRDLRADLYAILCAREALLAGDARRAPPVLQYAAGLRELFEQVAPPAWPARLRMRRGAAARAGRRRRPGSSELHDEDGKGSEGGPRHA